MFLFFQVEKLNHVYNLNFTRFYIFLRMKMIEELEADKDISSAIEEEATKTRMARINKIVDEGIEDVNENDSRVIYIYMYM